MFADRTDCLFPGPIDKERLPNSIWNFPADKRLLLTDFESRQQSERKNPKKTAEIAPKEVVKDSILDATDCFWARFGYQKMTVEDIAIEAGIGKGTIYLHFSSKEEVVLSHVDRIVERLKQHLADVARSKITAPERIRQMLLVRVLFRFDSIQHYTQSLDDLLAALRRCVTTSLSRDGWVRESISGRKFETSQSLSFSSASSFQSSFMLLDMRC